VKDQYFGDVNNYRKYGLLRALATAGSIGVCWLLTPDDGGNDGRPRRYLDEPSKWRRTRRRSNPLAPDGGWCDADAAVTEAAR